MILVTGAGGKTGRALIATLSKVEGVSALVHRQEHVSTVKALGADWVFVGDLLDETAVRSAMQGARAVYHICPNISPDEVVIGELVIGVAREIGVERFVYHSVLHPQIEQMPHHWAKLRVEETMFASGLAYTILQPAPYMQNLLAGWKNIMGDGILRVPYSIHSKFSFIDLEDLSEAASIVLTGPDHAGATYELVGTLPMTYVEVAGIVSRVLNRPVRAEKEEIGDWRLRAAGLSEFAVEGLVAMFDYYDRHGLVGNRNVLRWLLRREPASLGMFVERTVKEHYATH